MTKKIGDKKIGGISSTSSTHGIQSTELVKGTQSVSEVKGVAATSGVGAVQAAGAIGKRRPTRIMSIEERQQLLQTINEEAEKMFSSGILPASKKEIITKAVKMAVDSGLLPEEDEK